MILTLNIIPNGTTLVFDEQEYIKDAVNPYVLVSINPVYTIDIFAFERCWIYLTKIIIADTVTTIGASAFVNCESLTEIIIPESVTHIGASAFQSCTSLTKIVIPDSVTTIGNYVFKYCTSLTTIETNNEDAYIIEYCKTYYPSVEVIVCQESYVLK